MGSISYTSSYLTCILLLCTLLPTIKSDADGLVSGLYTVADSFEESPCFELTIDQNGTNISADRITYNDVACTGGDIQFQDELDTQPSASLYLEKLFSGKANRAASITCGEQTFFTPKLFYAFRLSTVPPQFVLDDVKDQLGIHFDADTLEAGREYVASTSCLWKRDGPVQDNGDKDGGFFSSVFSCFPPSATVRLETGQILPMDNLQIGHRVQTGPSRYSTVFSWTHRSPQIEAEFVRLHTSLRSPLVLTPSHYVYNGIGRLVLARFIKIGDSLIGGDGSNLTVHSIDYVRMKGLYNPQTMDGDIVVNDALVSTYTQAIKPTAAHAFLAPVRAFSRLFSVPTFLSL